MDNHFKSDKIRASRRPPITKKAIKNRVKVYRIWFARLRNKTLTDLDFLHLLMSNENFYYMDQRKIDNHRRWKLSRFLDIYQRNSNFIKEFNLIKNPNSKLIEPYYKYFKLQQKKTFTFEKRRIPFSRNSITHSKPQKTKFYFGETEDCISEYYTSISYN